ncbi:unnamed protein product [Paramecium sonneborni]|uniref:Uncharacterized protein n=1 Tax=Paramecium sonneborni TaxID=65129 RepID=A0A8S1M2Q4_9CILI|nr:unnamed protein product [Paramecium sonneborni]
MYSVKHHWLNFQMLICKLQCDIFLWNEIRSPTVYSSAMLLIV